MWRPCDTILDKPTRIWFFLVEDASTFLVLLLTLGMWYDLLLALAGAAAATGLLYRWKRGTPAGFLLHTLHSWQCLKLPGVLSPRRTTYSPW